jgi:hypothetical protein
MYKQAYKIHWTQRKQAVMSRVSQLTSSYSDSMMNIIQISKRYKTTVSDRQMQGIKLHFKGGIEKKNVSLGGA